MFYSASMEFSFNDSFEHRIIPVFHDWFMRKWYLLWGPGSKQKLQHYTTTREWIYHVVHHECNFGMVNLPNRVWWFHNDRQLSSTTSLSYSPSPKKEGDKKSQRDLGPAPGGIAWAVSPPGHIHCCTIGLSIARLWVLLLVVPMGCRGTDCSTMGLFWASGSFYSTSRAPLSSSLT